MNSDRIAGDCLLFRIDVSHIRFMDSLCVILLLDLLQDPINPTYQIVHGKVLQVVICRGDCCGRQYRLAYVECCHHVRP